MLSLSSEQLKNLEPLMLSENNRHYESDLYNYNDMIVKIFRQLDHSMNKRFTFNLLKMSSSSIPNNFCLPIDYIEIDNQFKGLVLPKIKGKTLEDILDDPNTPFKDKLIFLAKVGEQLDKMNDLRKNKELENFYIGDLHSANCMIDEENEIHFIDMDSCKIGHNMTSPSKHLVSLYFLSSIHNKYILNNRHIIEVNKDTDLLCYNMILLQFILGKDIYFNSKTTINKYILMLEKTNICGQIIESFKRLTSTKENINPYEEITSLTEENIEESKKLLKSKIL